MSESQLFGNHEQHLFHIDSKAFWKIRTGFGMGFIDYRVIMKLVQPIKDNVNDQFK